ncbi:ABC transporter permease [Ktedonosporobacter rubrisoli]|nr:ABC transporter permease [Ktedonosporobacter rubrisoli]
MEWHSLIIKNIRRNLRRYLGYLLASTVAILCFCMFIIFAANPEVAHGKAPSSARVLFTISQGIIAIFALFFIFYFHAALIRLRNKEFGLLLTLGVTRRQLGLMIFYESLFIGVLALVAGIGLGILASIPFTQAVSALLELPRSISFNLQPAALLTTLLLFGTIFLLDALLISLRVSLRTPRMLLLGARERQRPPRASWWKVLFGLLSLAAAYSMATMFSNLLIFNALPIIALTIIGTYFLFSQIFVMLLNALRRRSLAGIRLLTVSRLAYRMSDYSRMITTVTTLSAIVLVGMASVFGVQQSMAASMLKLTPFSLEYISGPGQTFPLSAQQVRATLSKHHFTLQEELATPVLTGLLTHQAKELPVTVLSLSQYRHLRGSLLQLYPAWGDNLDQASSLANGQAYFYAPPYVSDLSSVVDGKYITLKTDKLLQSLTIETGHAMVFNMDLPDLSSFLVVINDTTYAQMDKVVAPNLHKQIYSFAVQEWRQMRPAVDELRSSLTGQQQAQFSEIYTPYNANMQTFSLTLFATFFVSLLFFLAVGISLYFKLFTQQEEDRRQFRALERVGIQQKEGQSVLTLELLLLFFIPVLIAIIHAIFAMIDLAHQLELQGWDATPIWGAFAIVCACYLGCIALFFLAAHINYYRQLKAAVAPG